MEQYPSFSSDSPQNRQLVTLLNGIIGAATLLCVLLLFFVFAGYGTIRLHNLPGDADVSVNGHRVATAAVRLRPGSYRVAITSPRTAPFYDTLHVGPLRSIDYQPALKRRNPDAVAGSTIGAVNGSASAPQLEQAQWFEGGTWLAGRLKPSGKALALQYDSGHKRWSVGFYQTPGYPSDITKLPSDVAAYVGQAGQ